MSVKDLSHQLSVFPTELGWFGIALRGNQIERLVIGYDSSAEAERRLHSHEAAEDGKHRANPLPTLNRLERDLVRFASGEPVDFSRYQVELSHLTSFQQRVAMVVRGIEPGETLSYAEVAARAGSPGAARAVGNVMANNRVPIVIPCHRVLGSGGKLGGFSAPGGVSFKQRLLDLETGRTSPV